ncbi:hypothetical protein [Marinospirillum perlucidum]|uniref:hypothetical protein n=1 Tax=Marinospirillum perlucidum TaxID=1982602 RepID=UPI000DF27FA9|nr:hypothetical protein [Marinospirillum perlucidum]
MLQPLIKSRWYLLMAAIALTLCACGGGSGSSGSSENSSGEGKNADFPGSIIGERIEFTVTEALTQSSVSVGETVVYDYSSDGRVQGTNPETGQVLEPVRYEYEANDLSATILLFYEYNNGDGYEEYILTGDTTILEGSYQYEAVVTSPSQYSAGKAKGNYRIVPPNNVIVYATKNAASIPSTQEDIWQFLRRHDDIQTVAMERNRSAYVAIQENGKLIADTSLKKRDVQGDGTSEEVTVELISPPDGTYNAVEIYQSLGIAINNNDELWLWGGINNITPRKNTNLEAPVHSFIENSLGSLVITGTDRSPEYVCKESDGSCDFDTEQSELDALNITGVNKAILTALQGGPIFVYTDTNRGSLKIANACTGTSCNPPVLPSDLGMVVDFDIQPSSFIAAINSSGHVVVTNWEGNQLPIPTDISFNAVDLAVTSNHVAVVQKDGSVITWRYQSGQLYDLEAPSSITDITKVESTPYDGHFLFLQ